MSVSTIYRSNLFRIFTVMLLVVCSISAHAEDTVYRKEKLLTVFTGKADEAQFKDIPLYATYPSDFIVERRDVGAMRVVFIRSPSTDAEGFLADKGADSLGDGFFTIALSLNVGYDPSTDKFSGEDDLKDADKMKQAGLLSIVSKRLDTKGLPIRETVAEANNGRHIYLAYIALGRGGSTFRISYYHPQVYSAHDDEVWRAFMDGLAKK